MSKPRFTKSFSVLLVGLSLFFGTLPAPADAKAHGDSYEIKIYLPENRETSAPANLRLTVDEPAEADSDFSESQAVLEKLSAYIRSIGPKLGLSKAAEIKLRIKSIRKDAENGFVLLEQYVSSARDNSDMKRVPVDQATVAVILDAEGRILSINSGLVDPPELKNVFANGKKGIDMLKLSQAEVNLLIESIRSALAEQDEQDRELIEFLNQTIRNVNTRNDGGENLSAQGLMDYTEALIKEEQDYNTRLSAPGAEEEVKRINEEIALQKGLLKLELRKLEDKDLTVENLAKLPDTVLDVAIRYLFANIKPVGVLRIGLEASKKGMLSLSRYTVTENASVGGEVVPRERHVWMYTVKALAGLPVVFDLYIPEDGNSKQVLTMKNVRRLDTHAGINVYNSPNYPSGPSQPVYNADVTMQIFSEAVNYFYSQHGWNSYDRRGGAVTVHKAMTGKYKENAFWSSSNRMFGVGAGGSWLYNIDGSWDILGHEFAHAIVTYSSGLVYQGESGGLNEHFADIQGVAFEGAKRPGRSGSFDYKIGDTSTYGGKGLRNLEDPWSSQSTSFSHMDQVRRSYGANCQPSESNDQCGVHSTSGVPNKAISALVRKHGIEGVRRLVFNTVTNRLSSYSKFDDYLRQMVAECQTSRAIADCESVKEAFYQVGLRYPGYTPGGSGGGQDDGGGKSEMWCGKVIETAGGNVTVEQYSEEGRVSAGQTVQGARFILNSAHYRSMGLQSVGYYDQLLGKTNQRYCVKGQTSLVWNKAGIGFQAYRVITEISPEGGGSQQPTPEPPGDDSWEGTVAKYCGLINAKAGAENINIIDNNFDAFILTSKFYQDKSQHTVGWSIYKDFFTANGALHQKCGCATGIIHQVANSKGNYFNAFKRVTKVEVIPQSRCQGLVFR